MRILGIIAYQSCKSILYFADAVTDYRYDAIRLEVDL